MDCRLILVCVREFCKEALKEKKPQICQFSLEFPLENRCPVVVRSSFVIDNYFWKFGEDDSFWIQDVIYLYILLQI
jgi:hypothetical protein